MSCLFLLQKVSVIYFGAIEKFSKCQQILAHDVIIRKGKRFYLIAIDLYANKFITVVIKKAAERVLGQ